MENIKRVLVVDDEKKIQDVIKAYLEKEGFEVVTVGDGESALKIFEKEIVHLIILDLMLPKISGEEVCRKIRTVSEVPIIMLTARVEEDERIEGLSIGADDYVIKPFSVRELVERVRALIRRTYRNDAPLAEHLTFNNGDLELDVKKFEVRKNGSPAGLTNHEFKILNMLLSSPGQVFTREQLVEKVLGFDYEGFDRTIDSHIKNIRQKIEDNPREPKYIITVYGIGYKFGWK